MTSNEQFAIEVLRICEKVAGRRLTMGGPGGTEPDPDAIDELKGFGSRGERSLLALYEAERGVVEGSMAWVVSACDKALADRVFEAQRAAYEPVSV